MKIYVLKNCDTCRKALQWVNEQQLDHECTDVRVDGVSRDELELIVSSAGRDKVVNKRSTTWRTLPEAERAKADSDAGAVDLLFENPTLMKRPVFVTGLNAYVGFDEGTKVILSQA